MGVASYTQITISKGLISMNEVRLGKVKFYEDGRGLNVLVGYVDMEGRSECVRAAVSEKYGINFSATGSLDKNGIAAFNRLVAIATALYEGGNHE